MRLIQKITTDPLQKQSFILENGLLVTFVMYYRPQQKGWFFNSIVYQDFEIRGLRITVSPNMLYQFQNQIPFGIQCYSGASNREPTEQEDFASGAVKLYVLDEADMLAYAEYLQGG